MKEKNSKKIDGIYLQIKTVLAKPENKRRLRFVTVITVILSILVVSVLTFSSPKNSKAAVPAYVNAGAVYANTGSGVVGLPSGITANDILLLFIETENEAVSVTTAGSCTTWAAVADSPQGTGVASATDATRLTAYWCRYGGSGTTGPTISDSGDHQLARIIAVSGVITTGDPWDVTSAGVEAGNNDTSGVIPGDTTTDADRFIVAAITTALPDANGTAGFSSFTNADLANFTEQTDNTTNAGTGGGLGIATGEKATPGSYGNTTVTTSSNTAKAYMTIALKPAPSTITVGNDGTQTSSMLIPSTNQYVGGAFTFIRNENSANVTSIIVSEADTSFSASSYLANLDLYYETAATCTYNGTETLFGTATLFSSEKATVSGTMAVSTSQICVYAVVDVVSGAPNGDYFDLEITDPSTEVTVSSGLVSPATATAISGSTQVNLAPATKIDHYRWRNDNGPQGNQPQSLYFNPTDNGYGTADFSIVSGCTAGSEWDCLDDDTADTASSEPTGDLETSQLLLAAATDYYTLADDMLLAGSTITQLDITVKGADDIGNPNTSVTLGYCIVGGANDCGTADTMGSSQAINGTDQTKTEQFSGLSLSTTDLNNLQLVIAGSGVKAEISTLYVLVTYSISEATWLQTEDTVHSGLSKDTNTRLRFQIDNTGGAATNYNYRLEWAARGGDSACDTNYSGETYYAVPDTPTTEHFDMTLSSAPGYVDGEATTAKLSNGEGYSFIAGNTVESASNQTGNITLGQNEYTEVEYVFQANTNATDGGVYCFRVTNASVSLNSADVIAQLTLASGVSNQNPNSPTSLTQKTSPGGANITESAWTIDNTPDLGFTITDPDGGDTVKYEIQLATDSGFSSLVLDYTHGSLSANGATFAFTVGSYGGGTCSGTCPANLADSSGGYWWRVKAIDNSAAESSYSEFGVAATMDLKVDATSPTGGSVYDGTTGDQDWNNGSLTVLEANWTGFNADASGLLKYEYAVRRASDGYYWNTAGPAWQVGEVWYNNTTNTTASVTPIYLNTGVNYYFSVKCYDNAGNIETAVSSNGQQVAPTLSFSYDTNSITFANLNSTNSWTDTKTNTFTTSTNAESGYAVKGYISQVLTSLAYPTVTIPNFSYNGASWASPQTWSAGQYGFGYTSNDTLVQGSNRFASGTKFAPFSQTSPGDVIADHTDTVNGQTGAVSNEQFTITYKVSTSASQAASTYRTYATYYVTANY